VADRLERPASGSGARLELRGSHSAEFRGRGSWISYGGTAGVFLDVNGRSRVLSLSGAVQFTEGIDNTEVPFTELIALGGFGPMRGFYPGRLLGQSAFVSELAYRWPIWIWLDGSMRFEMGNVFSEHLEGLSFRNLRISGAIGVESAGVADNPLEVLIGFGTERIADEPRRSFFPRLS
jgi:outer membrane protein assembly factor BamA